MAITEWRDEIFAPPIFVYKYVTFMRNNVDNVFIFQLPLLFSFSRNFNFVRAPSRVFFFLLVLSSNNIFPKQIIHILISVSCCWASKCDLCERVYTGTVAPLPAYTFYLEVKLERVRRSRINSALLQY